MAEPLKTRKEQFAQWTADEINQEYKLGYLTAHERNKLLREKAHWTMDELLGEKGYGGAVVGTMLEHINKGWENLKTAATREPIDPLTEPGKAAKDVLYATGQAIWGQIEMLTSALSAFGEVNGAVAERWALANGLAPGAARVLNIAVDVGSGFIPVGTAAKSFVRGVQGVQEAAAARALKKALSAEAKATEATAAAGKAAVAEPPMAEALTQGLAVEGVIGKEAQAVATATQGVRGGSVAEQFTADLRKFRREMGAITEKQSHEQTAALAERLGLSLEDLKNVIPGQALDEKQMLAYLKALEPQVTTAIDLAKAAVTGGEAEANRFAQHMSEFFSVAPIFRGAEVTAGRSVQILTEKPAMKKITDLLAGWDPESMAKGNFQGAIKTLAEDLVAIADQPDKVAALAVQMQSNWQRAGSMGRELYTNLLLARPVTQVRNVIGNSFAATNSVLEMMTGAMFSADKAAGLTGKDGVYLLKGMHAALGDGLKAYAQAFSKLSPEEISKLDYIPGAIPGVMGSIIRTPGNSLMGMDNFFKTILRRGSYYAEAMRDGTHMGLTGRALDDFVARRVNNPTQTMLANGETFALHNTFQNELGTLGKKIAEIAQTGPLVYWFTFMKTPIQIAKYSWNRTPGLQFLSKSLYEDIAAGGVRADMAIGRLTLSNLQGMFIFELAKEGLIEGSGPVDPQLRAAWLAAGHVPYSVRLPNGTRIPISNFEPWNTPLGLVADYTQIVDHLDEPSVAQGAMAVVFTLMKGMADKTYWRTVNDLVDVASGMALGHEPTTKTRDALMSPLTTVVTGGPLVGGVERAIDPTLREGRSYIDSLVAKVPGYSKTLPPVRDGYGDPVLPPIAVGGSWAGLVNPIQTKPASTDRVKIEGDRLQVRLPKFPWTLGGTIRDGFDIRDPFPEDKLGVELTPKQRDTQIQMYRNMLRHPEYGIEKALLDTPEYQEATRAAQRQMFSGLLAEYWQNAGQALQVQDVELGKKIIQSQANQVAPLLKEQDRQQLKQDTQLSIDLFTDMAPEMQDNLLRYGIYGEESK